MRPEWRRHLSTRAPRYTSYPTALDFSADVRADDYAAKLDRIAPYQPVSLYVHVPFCRRLCWYCGCNMRVENDYGRALDFVGALTAEIASVGDRLAGRGRPSSVHFGGGTPNYLEPEEIGSILSAIEAHIGLTDDAQLAIELDPRMMRENEARELVELGFRRMSLGVQDFDFHVQAAINRLQSFELIESCVGAIRSAGVADLSFDLVYGLPRQTVATFDDTIEKTIALSPDRVSVFGYAHLPNSLPRQRMIREADLPDEALRMDLAELADLRLVAAGFQRIGFDHYAKVDNPLAEALRQGRLRRNFQGFTDDVAEAMIGLGPSAIGFVDGLYIQNSKDLAKYATAARSGDLATERGVCRSPVDEAVARTISDLLCRFETDLSGLRASLPAATFEKAVGRLDALAADGVVVRSGDVLALNPAAHALARVVAGCLDPRAHATARMSQAV